MKTKKLLFATGLAGAMIVSACTGIDTFAEDPNQRTKEGATIGAITGAIFGASRATGPGAKRNAAVVGGIVGGLAGGAIGKRLDAQAADLHANISNDRIQIVNTGSELVVTMPQDILFAFDSAAIAPALRSDLRALSGSLQRFPGSDVIVTGHTDNVGAASYNLDLSRRRAAAVGNILIANGVSAGRIRTVGRGESDPVATNLNATGRSQNRRVEIVIRPRG